MIAHAGNIPPVEVFHTEGFALLASFVAVNSMLYLGLTVVKILPAPRISWRGRDRRAETRSIYPDEPARRDGVSRRSRSRSTPAHRARGNSFDRYS